MVAQAWFLISSALLVVSGIAKLVDPVPTMGALRAAGLPDQRWMVRLLGLTEIVVAVAAIVWGGFAVAGVAVMYLAFTVFVVVAIRGDLPLSSCGCFGRTDTPPTWLHAGYNASAAAAALAMGIAGQSGLDVFDGLSWYQSVAYVAFVGLGVYVSYLVLSELPSLLAASRSA